MVRRGKVCDQYGLKHGHDLVVDEYRASLVMVKSHLEINLETNIDMAHLDILRLPCVTTPSGSDRAIEIPLDYLHRDTGSIGGGRPTTGASK
jgi:hypothetical protein